MRFSLSLILALAVTSIAAPTANPQKRQAGVLTSKAYKDFQVSDGVAGNALAEVNAQFPIDQSDLANVAKSDLDIISAAADTAEDAETEAGGFNDAIDAAGGTKSAAGKPLQIGKIKNKVLKLQTDVLRLQILVAQGETDRQEQLDGQIKKLNKNVKLDEDAAGERSQSVDFQG